MSLTICLLVGLIGLSTLFVLGTFVYRLIRHHFFVQRELKDVLLKCRQQQKKCLVGIAVFKAPPDEKYLYDILVRQGNLVDNPTGGYTFPEEINKLWYGVPREFSRVSRDEYKEDDVIACNFDDKGNPIDVVKESELLAKRKAEKEAEEAKDKIKMKLNLHQGGKDGHC